MTGCSNPTPRDADRHHGQGQEPALGHAAARNRSTEAPQPEHPGDDADPEGHDHDGQLFGLEADRRRQRGPDHAEHPGDRGRGREQDDRVD